MSTSAINLTNSILDVAGIVDNLIYIDSAPVRDMQRQVSTLESKVKAYQSLNTMLSALSDTVNKMLFGDTEAPFNKPYSFADRLSDSIFASCQVKSSNEDAVSATASNAMTGGSYSILVNSLAQAQSMASTGFADTTSTATGTGTITIAKAGSDPVTININGVNGTLKGVCDAINNANAGVTATIINDGSATAPYRLLIRANDTGTANSFTITENLTGGQAPGFTQTQAASDAQFVVNGISIVKSSNTVSDVIDGVTFTLKEASTSPVTLTVEKNIDAVVEAMKEFAAAYNNIAEFINSQFKYSPETGTAGVLAGDSTLRRIQSNLQTQIIRSVSNQFTGSMVAGQAGLEFNRDGSLTVNESKLREALADDFNAVAALFLGDGMEAGGVATSDFRVAYGGKTPATQSGTYAIQVDSLAEQASVRGAQAITTLIRDETLTITSGGLSAVVSLLRRDSLSTVLFKINAALSARGMAITAADDGGRIRITSNSYGSSQNITVVSTGDGTAGTSGFSGTSATDIGADIAGTIGGHAAIGSGLTLTGAAGQPEEGLVLSIAQTTTGSYGTVTVAPDSEGIAGASILMSLSGILDGITDPLSGPIHSATDGLNRSIENLNDQIEAYQERLEKKRVMLTQEFNEADEALRLMSVTQAQLQSQISTLSSK